TPLGMETLIPADMLLSSAFGTAEINFCCGSATSWSLPNACSRYSRFFSHPIMVAGSTANATVQASIERAVTQRLLIRRYGRKANDRYLMFITKPRGAPAQIGKRSSQHSATVIIKSITEFT